MYLKGKHHVKAFSGVVANECPAATSSRPFSNGMIPFAVTPLERARPFVSSARKRRFDRRLKTLGAQRLRKVGLLPPHLWQVALIPSSVTSNRYQHAGEQPLRQWLMENGYRILCEEVLHENRFYYEIIVAERVGPVTYTAEELYFGPLQMQARSPAFLVKWQRILRHKQQTLTQ